MRVVKRLLLLALGLHLALPLLHAQSLASAKAPAYPLAAKAAGIEGSVTLRGTVSKQGRMQNVRVLSGPPELRQAAIDAVNAWVYKPYRQFGRLVEVDTTVTVNFNMGTGAKKAEEQAQARAALSSSPQTAEPTSPLPAPVHPD